MPSLPSLRSSGGGPPRPRVPIPPARAVVDCAVYVDGERKSGRRSYSEALAEVTATGQGFVWVGLHAPDDQQMAGVADTFGLHELMVEDAVHAHQRPKLERYDDTQFIVLRTVKYVEHDSLATTKEVVETGEIMIFVGKNFVITVRHGDFTHLAGVRQYLENRPDRLTLGPYAVMHAIADHVVDTYLEVTAAVEHDVDAIEEAIFSPSGAIDIDSVYLLKREMTELRRAVAPLTVPLQRLTSSDNDLCPKEVRRYMRDVADHHTSAVEQISTFDEVLTSLLEAASAKVAIQQNTDMRKITSWVAIASVPTMVAGIYGMNFDNMPELHWHYFYYCVLGFLVVVSVTLWRTFRRNHWL
ncbi:MAG: magnesium and cobalt transport protein CorA [Corynebacteriales bacterium]|nr:magnesium and cobalt transport protein CorA [Mycobacteriales bacterium]